MIALPLLLLWAVTGMGYEFGFVEKAWYQAVPGEAQPEVVLESAESEEPDLARMRLLVAAYTVLAVAAERRLRLRPLALPVAALVVLARRCRPGPEYDLPD